MKIIICKNCGHEMVGCDNHYGKLCLNCGFFIEPESDIQLVRDNKKVKEKYSLIAINNIKDKFLNRGDKDDNKIG